MQFSGRTSFVNKEWASWRVVCVCLLWTLTTAMEGVACRVEQTFEGSSPRMVRILVGDCSPEEREALAVLAHDVLTALLKGQGVELEGVVLKGDLMLDALPLEPLPNHFEKSSLVKDRFAREKLEAVRILRGPLIFRDVEVRGILATNLIDRGFLIVQSPVSITGSTFRRSVDFSRSVFQESVDFSGTTIEFEGFFIQAMFLNLANFTHTQFGTHSRFHKAVFADQALFSGATFLGLAEFLEVGWQKKADFSHAKFQHGTGFSGSQFEEVPDFSNATFERETFFRFAQFKQGANFRSGTFRMIADFTEVGFGGDSNFSHVNFQEPPQFTDEALARKFRSQPALMDPQIQAGLFVLGGLFLVVFYYLFKAKNGKVLK